ncbi:hypothetical protein F4827_000264 [Paraburkholderia bannensis]|uniref:Uncharacterized protein n=1 Tax=Paraburkholderia bannensis TaxID=765414 RepID=A0A7W9TU64_9BURK|nr:hypothetical protein [Paraburkholderia sp. WP4_3_2]MBB6100460.1 hypothetical protein [Paraburkholderia bannensis]
MFLVSPAGFEFFVNLAGGLVEAERGGGSGGGLLSAVAFFDWVFTRVKLGPHRERLGTRVQYRGFRIYAEARIAPLASYWARET